MLSFLLFERIILLSVRLTSYDLNVELCFNPYSLFGDCLFISASNILSNSKKLTQHKKLLYRKKSKPA